MLHVVPQAFGNKLMRHICNKTLLVNSDEDVKERKFQFSTEAKGFLMCFSPMFVQSCTIAMNVKFNAKVNANQLKSKILDCELPDGRQVSWYIFRTLLRLGVSEDHLDNLIDYLDTHKRFCQENMQLHEDKYVKTMVQTALFNLAGRNQQPESWEDVQVSDVSVYYTRLALDAYTFWHLEKIYTMMKRRNKSRVMLSDLQLQHSVELWKNNIFSFREVTHVKKST